MYFENPPNQNKKEYYFGNISIQNNKFIPNFLIKTLFWHPQNEPGKQKKRQKDRFPTSVFVSQRGFQRCFLRYALALSELPPTTDTQKGNSLHCMVENSTQSQIFRYGRSIFCLPHRPNFSNICDLCLHWVSVVRVSYYRSFFPFLLRSKLAQNVSPYQI